MPTQMPIADNSPRDMVITYEILTLQSILSPRTAEDISRMIKGASEYGNFSMTLQSLATLPIYKFATVFHNVSITDLAPITNPMDPDDGSPAEEVASIDAGAIVGGVFGGLVLILGFSYYVLRRLEMVGDLKLFLNSVVPVSSDEEEIGMLNSDDEDDDDDSDYDD